MSPLEKWVVSRGTDGSNLAPSSGQSVSHAGQPVGVEKPGFSARVCGPWQAE
jgi:hypothetical protein